MKKICIALVGLPARGKSTVASKLMQGLTQEGLTVRVFNNGDLRRKFIGERSSHPEFYNPENLEGRDSREDLAKRNLMEAQRFLAEEGDVAILDATNASFARRKLIYEGITEHPVLFVECVNDDPELLEASIMRKAKMPEFANMSRDEAVLSFKKRVEYYEKLFDPLEKEANYLRLDSLNTRIIEEKVTPQQLPYYIRIRDILVSDWVRNLYLVRHGQTYYNLEKRIGGDAELTEKGLAQAEALGKHFRDITIPYIFTSTRRRSHQTANPIQAVQEHCTTIALSEFDEIDAGVCEHMRYEDIRSQLPQEFDGRLVDKYNYVYPEGEGYVTMKERVDRGLKKAMYLSGNAEALMIVGHQAINRMILSHFLFRRTEDVPYIYIPQDQYFHIVSTQKKKLFELVRFTGAAKEE